MKKMAQNWSPGTSGSCLSPIKSNSINMKLALTEENLDYLLRQEYSLSQISFDADQLSLGVLDKTTDLSVLKNFEQVNKNETVSIVATHVVTLRERFDLENRIITNIGMSNQKIGLDQEDENNLNNIKSIIVKPVGELFKVGVCGSEFITLYNFCLSKYSNSLDGNWNEKMSKMRKIVIEHRFPLVKKNSFFFKIKNLTTIPKHPKTLTLNSSITKKMCPKLHLHSCSCLQLRVTRSSEKEIDEVNSYSDTKQRQISSINRCPLKEHRESLGLIMNSNSDYISSVRNLAVSSSFQDIKFIDADEDGLTPTAKTNYSKAPEMTETGLDNLVKSFTNYSANFQLRAFENIVSVKSNLKRKISAEISNKKNKLKKSGLKFTNVTIFYFERSQGFSSVPAKGGSTLGMVDEHFYITTIPIDEYEHKKNQRGLPKLRMNNAMSNRKLYIKEKAKNVQALTLCQRMDLLENAGVQIELKEADDCAYLRASRASPGCDCRDYCDPDICDCSLAGIECQVDRPNFPCGCTKENCRNVMGRNEYNHNKVKTHFIRTIRKVNLESKGRISKRKQASPSKVMINSSDTKTDIDMMQI